MTRAARRLLLPHYCNCSYCTGTGIIRPLPLFHALVAIRLAVAGGLVKGGWGCKCKERMMIDRNQLIMTFF